MSMTKEQEIFLQSLEKEFENRYTEMDEEFKALLNAKPPTPPICENYFVRFDHRHKYENNKAHSYNSSYRKRGWNGGDEYSAKKKQWNDFGDNFRVRYSDEFRNKKGREDYYSSRSSYESKEYNSSPFSYESKEQYSHSSYKSKEYYSSPLSYENKEQYSHSSYKSKEHEHNSSPHSHKPGEQYSSRSPYDCINNSRNH